VEISGDVEWEIWVEFFFWGEHLDAYLIQNVSKVQKKKKRNDLHIVSSLRKEFGGESMQPSFFYVTCCSILPAESSFKSLSLCGRRIQFPFPLAQPSLMIWYKLASFGERLAT
jgi:hypothetical protein